MVVDQKLHEATRKAVYDWGMLAPAVNTLLSTDSIWATVWVYSIAIAYQRQATRHPRTSRKVDPCICWIDKVTCDLEIGFP